MEIRQFDRMAIEDQQHYVAFLVKETQKLLIEQGRRDLAVKVYHLFHDIPPGEQLSIGEAQLKKTVDDMVAYMTKYPFPGVTSQIEDVVIGTLIKNGIEVPRRFSRDLAEATRNRVFFQKPE